MLKCVLGLCRQLVLTCLLLWLLVLNILAPTFLCARICSSSTGAARGANSARIASTLVPSVCFQIALAPLHLRRGVSTIRLLVLFTTRTQPAGKYANGSVVPMRNWVAESSLWLIQIEAVDATCVPITPFLASLPSTVAKTTCD